MTIRGKAHIVGAYEHPGRRLPDSTVPRIHAEVVTGALADAGLTLGRRRRLLLRRHRRFRSHLDGRVPRAARGVRGLHRDRRLVVRRARRPRRDRDRGRKVLDRAGQPRRIASLGGAGRPGRAFPEGPFENNWGMIGPVSNYAIAARRHMYEFGTTSAQLAEIKVAASLHAQHNPHALLHEPGHGRRGARLAHDRRPAAPSRLLRGHRRRRCGRRHERRRSRATSRAAASRCSVTAKR